MLTNVDFTPTLSKAAYKKARRWQRQRLYELERRLFNSNIPTIIVFEGWDTGGRGETIQEITRRLDPRGYDAYEILPPRTIEAKHPWLWRFWTKIPSRGRMAIFDASWYWHAVNYQLTKLKSKTERQSLYDEINSFERLLANDGTVFIKLWFHISAEEQLRRFIKRTRIPEEAWRVTAIEWERHQRYDELLQVHTELLTQTHTSYAPWTIIPANNAHYRAFMTFRTIINTLESVLALDITPWPSLDELEAEIAERGKPG